MMRATAILLGALIALASTASAQSGQGQPSKPSQEPPKPSLAEIAQQNREKKQASASKKAEPAKAEESQTKPEESKELTLAERARLNRQRKSGAAGTAKTPPKGKPVSNEEIERPGEHAKTEELEEEGPATAAKSKPAEKRNLPQAEDPEYYRLRLQPLREELKTVEAELRRLQSNSRYDYRTDSVVDRKDARYDRTPVISNTIKNDIERYESKKRDLLKRIAEIEEEAARNGVNPYSRR